MPVNRLRLSFYPRPPRGGRPALRLGELFGIKVSTHVLLAEDDTPEDIGYTEFQGFYPRPPRGGRHKPQIIIHREIMFLPTSSSRRTTRLAYSTFGTTTCFYPRPPRGGRPCLCAKRRLLTPFLPTSSSRRTTICAGMPVNRLSFYPRPPRGGRPRWRTWTDGDERFYPRPPRGGRPSLIVSIGVTFVFLPTSSSRRTTSARSDYGGRF